MELVALRWRQGHATAEIGRLKGRSEDAVRKLHPRAMEALRGSLEAA